MIAATQIHQQVVPVLALTALVGCAGSTKNGHENSHAAMDAATVFHFTKGKHVAFSRGSGEIVQGYASGKIIQYEIKAASGEHFMASEDEIQTQ